RRPAGGDLSARDRRRLAPRRPHPPAPVRPGAAAPRAPAAGRRRALRPDHACRARRACRAAPVTGGAIVVLDGGVQATVQDLGRPGWTALGVAHSGAADALSLRIGNRLVGNDDGAAGLELTLVGGALRCTRDAVVALTGAPLEARIERTGARLPRFAAATIAAVDVPLIRCIHYVQRAHPCLL